ASSPAGLASPGLRWAFAHGAVSAIIKPTKPEDKVMMLRRVFLGAATAIVAAGPIAAEPVTLKLNSPAPPMSYVHREVLTPWAEAVTADSGGTLKIQTFYGGTLGSFANTYDRVVDEVVDIGFILTAFAA